MMKGGVAKVYCKYSGDTQGALVNILWLNFDRLCLDLLAFLDLQNDQVTVKIRGNTAFFFIHVSLGKSAPSCLTFTFRKYISSPCYIWPIRLQRWQMKNVQLPGIHSRTLKQVEQVAPLAQHTLR